jgi:hypothetical protein
MRTAPALPLAALLGLAACGGSSSPAAPTLNPFLGTLTISSVSSTNTCLSISPVTFTAAGVDHHTVTVAGGDCLSFTNDDTASHQPASIGTPACAELNGPVLVHLGTFTTVPLSGPRTCTWQDALNPPGAGGGGGGY